MNQEKFCKQIAKLVQEFETENECNITAIYPGDIIGIGTNAAGEEHYHRSIKFEAKYYYFNGGRVL